MGMRRVEGPNGLVQYVEDGEEEQASPAPTPAAPAPRQAYVGSKADWLTGQGYQNRGGDWYSPGGEFMSNNLDGIEPGMWDHARNPGSQIVPGQYDKPLTPQQAQASVQKHGASVTRPQDAQQASVNSFAQKYGGSAQVHGASVPPPPPPPPPPAVSIPPRPAPLSAGPTPTGGVGAVTQGFNAEGSWRKMAEEMELQKFLSPYSPGGAPAAGGVAAPPAPATMGPPAGGAATTSAPVPRSLLDDVDLLGYIERTFKQPSPYDEAYIAREKAQIQTDRKLRQEESQRAIREEMGARGLIGEESSPWAGELADLEKYLTAETNRSENALLTRVAEAEQQGRQFGAQMATNLMAFNESRRQFDTSRGDRRYEFETSLGENRRQFDVGADLQRTQLALSKYGIDVNTSLQEQALALQKWNLQADDAYRYTVLDVDGKLRTRALDLQAQGLQADQAFRQAELELRQTLGTGELAVREKEAAAQIANMDQQTRAFWYNWAIQAAAAGLSPEQIREVLTTQIGQGNAGTATQGLATAVPAEKWKELGLNFGQPGERRKGKDGRTYEMRETAGGRDHWFPVA